MTVHRRGFVIGLASVIAAPAVIAAPMPIMREIKYEKRVNEVFDFTRYEGSIYIYNNTFSCCRFMFSVVNHSLFFRANYAEDCTFERVMQDGGGITENVFVRCSFDDIVVGGDPQIVRCEAVPTT